MEEIDKIIIESLKSLPCDIDNDIKSLKDFTPELILSTFSTCLESIKSEKKFPKTLPSSMSLKLNITSNLAQEIKSLGFKGDLGYQTILYFNENEIRKVLMFLIERLPREANKVTTINYDNLGYVPKLCKEIEEKIKISLQLDWIPTSFLNKGCRRVNNMNIMHSFGNSKQINCNYFTTNKRYHSLITSIYANDWHFHKSQFKNTLSLKDLPKAETLLYDNMNNIDLFINTTTSIVNNEINDPRNEILKELEINRNKLINLQNNVKINKQKLSQISLLKSDEEQIIENLQFKTNVKTKTLAVITKEENKIKLKNLIDKNTKKLVTLANQWNNIQNPLLEEYKLLQSQLNNVQSKSKEEKFKLEQIKNNIKELKVDLKEKEITEKHLKEKLDKLSKTNIRSEYTQRILEIIGNIKKQDEEIEKILKDTRLVQKEINNLTGQVERSFTLSDELIFRDAKHDDTARKAYKLLAQLRDESNEIIKNITDLGTIERESRNLQEQIDIETTKENSQKLERINQDLEEVRREINILMK